MRGFETFPVLLGGGKFFLKAIDLALEGLGEFTLYRSGRLGGFQLFWHCSFIGLP